MHNLMNYEKEVATKKIVEGKFGSVEEWDIKSVTESIFEYIKYFNSMPEGRDRVFDVNFNQIKVFEEWAPFFLPESVKVDQNDVMCIEILLNKDACARDSKPFYYKKMRQPILDENGEHVLDDKGKVQYRISKVKVDMSWDDWHRLQGKFRALARKQRDTGFTYLSDVRKKVNLSDIWSRIAIYKGDTLFMDSVTFESLPIPVKSSVVDAYYGIDETFCVPANKVVDKFIDDWKAGYGY